jgi:hypothetical protein
MNYCSKETDLQEGGVDRLLGKYRLKICGSSRWISSQFIAWRSDRDEGREQWGVWGVDG